MKIYSHEDRFSPTTGKIVGKQLIVNQILCDYCGNKLTTDDDEDLSLEVSYRVNELGGCEETYYPHDLNLKEIKYKTNDPDEYSNIERIRAGEIFHNTEFYFCRRWHGDEPNCEEKLVKKHLEFCEKEGHLFNLFESFYISKLNLLRKLLVDQTYCIEEFGFDEFE